MASSDEAEQRAAAFLREARGIDATEIVPMRADPALAHTNVSVGIASVLAYESHVKAHLPHVDLEELRSLPDLAHAVIDAARAVEGAPDGEEAEGTAMLEEGFTLRRRLRSLALALVESGALAARDAQKLGSDRGAVDVGADCLALGALFERRAADLGGQAPDPADVSRASEIGRALRARHKPAGAARKAGADGLSPIERRDRLWTLLLHRHERLWAVGAYIYGHAVDEHVPALHSPPRPARRGKSRS